MFDALVSFTFNLGALQRSTLLRKVNRGEYYSIHSESLQWVLAAVVGSSKERTLTTLKSNLQTLRLEKLMATACSKGDITPPHSV